MWNDILLLNKVNMTKSVNGLFYSMQKLPLVGSHIPSKVYSYLRLKNILGIVAFIFRLFLSIGKNILYLFLCYAVPLSFLYVDNLTSEAVQNSFLMSLILLSGCLGSLVNGILWNVNSDTYSMIKLLRMEAKRYLVNNAVYHYTLNCITLTIVSCGICLFFGLPFWHGILCGLLYVTSHVSLDGLYLYLFDRTGHTYMSESKTKMILTTSLLIGAYALMGFKVPVSFVKELFYIVTAIFTVSSIFSIRYLKNSNSYKDILIPLFQNLVTLDLLDPNKGDILKKDVDLDVKDYNSEELKQSTSSKKQGYAYMNELFFKRHKRLVYRPIRLRMLIILVAGAALFALSFLMEDSLDSVQLIDLLPPCVFFMYILNISMKTTKAMFMNCDVSLLHYGYYRQPKAIFENFRIRLKTLSYYNLLIAIVLCAVVNLLTMRYPISFTWASLFLFDITIIILSVFFSVHYLFVYYIFQPYTEEFDMKNPFMSILNGIVYFLCYMCLQLDGNIWFATGVLVATVLYICISLLLVWRLAPKTFHLK